MNDALVQNIEHILLTHAQVFHEQGRGDVVDGVRTAKISYQAIKSDGSIRSFCRVFLDGSPLCIAAAPGNLDDQGLAESRSAVLIGRHLFAKKVVVPQIFAWDENSGIILSEDAGDIRLHDQIGAMHSLYADQNIAQEECLHGLERLYLEVVERLCHMQCAGGVDFDSDWCYDGALYDRDVMVQRESEYFYRAFWKGLLQGEDRPAIRDEFQDMAEKAGQGRCGFFLHRDFQSRNIMLSQRGLRFIDYQAGRLGPLGYDLASLLIDPYANLPARVQEKVLHHYLEILQQYTTVNEDEFLRQYSYLALQRNLQILGAFSFLFQIRGKIFFKGFIRPALALLQKRLMLPEFSRYTVLKKIVQQGSQMVRDLTI